MQILAGIIVGGMLAGGTFAVVKVVQIYRADKAANSADAGLQARQPDSADPSAGGGAAPGGGTGTGTSAGANPGGGGGNPAAGSLEVPNLIGISAETAINELRERGIKEVKLTSDAGQGIDASKSAEWTVVKQSEKPGAKVGASTVITLTCTRGY
jgi:hypothetical protein